MPAFHSPNRAVGGSPTRPQAELIARRATPKGRAAQLRVIRPGAHISQNSCDAGTSVACAIQRVHYLKQRRTEAHTIHLDDRQLSGEGLERGQEVARHALQSCRSIARGLSPVTETQGGLVA